jgi:hypothetical protein
MLMPQASPCGSILSACYTLKPVPRRFYAVWGGSGVTALRPVWVSRFAAAINKASKGDLSQNAASGRATASASTSGFALARSG